MEFTRHVYQTRTLAQGPSLPSWPTTLRIALASLKTTLGLVKDNIHHAQSLTTGPIPPAPNMNVRKVQIPRRQDWIPEGLAPELSRGFVPGETLYWKPLVQSACFSITEEKSPLIDEQIILFAHGGAFFVCSPQTHRGITMRLSRHSGAKVLAIDYRLSPQFTFPAALHDMISAYLYLIDPPSGQPKYEPEQIVFSGDSAGGNLCFAAALWLRKKGLPLPGGIAAISPWMDLSHSMPSFKTNGPYDYLPDQSCDERYINEGRCHYYLPDNTQFQNPFVSPLFASPEEFGDLPPTLIQIGDAEKLRDENILFTLRFSQSPIALEMYEDMVHVFHLFAPFDNLSALALTRIGEFIRSLNTLSPRRQSHSQVYWCRRSGQQTLLKDPLHIIKDGRAFLKDAKKWSSCNEDTYTQLVEPMDKPLQLDPEEAVHSVF